MRANPQRTELSNLAQWNGMNHSEALEGVRALRDNLENSATPNTQLAITYQAYIAALVYDLAYLDTMAGFFYGMEARAQAKKERKGGEGVRIRYEKFVEQYLSPAHSGCDYSQLDLYESLRCNMLHNLMSGHTQKGKYQFLLYHTMASAHGQIKDSTVILDVPVFCDDVLHAAGNFLQDVEQSLSQSPEPSLSKNFKYWWDNGYSILASKAEPERLAKEGWPRSFIRRILALIQKRGAG